MTVIKNIMKTDTKAGVIRLNTPTINKYWDEIGDIEAPNYVGIVELVRTMSIFYDNHSELVCEKNEQNPVGLALLSLRNDIWADINMTRVNDHAKRLKETLFKASDTRVWKERNTV